MKFSTALVLVFSLGAAAVAPSAFAAIDVSSAATAITTDGSKAISEIGAAMIGLAAIAIVFKWAKGAIFG